MVHSVNLLTCRKQNMQGIEHVYGLWTQISSQNADININRYF